MNRSRLKQVNPVGLEAKLFLNFEETAFLLNVSKGQVEKWRSKGALPITRIGRRILFAKEDVARFALSLRIRAKGFG